MEQRSFFPDPRRNASDEEVVRVLQTALLRGGRLPRMAELYLSSVCAEHLVEQLYLAGFDVVERMSVRLRD